MNGYNNNMPIVIREITIFIILYLFRKFIDCNKLFHINSEE